MTDKRVVVPPEMVEAARKAVHEQGFSRSDAFGAAVDIILEAALLYQREHPPVPTEKQFEELENLLAEKRWQWPRIDGCHCNRVVRA